MKASVLIVDDEKNILATLSRALRVEDFDVDIASSAETARKRIDAKSYDVILLDVKLPGTDGIAFLRSIREEGSEIPVVVMSGHGTIETAVEATRLGAHDFLEKPIGTERLLLSLSHLLDLRRLEEENVELRRRAGATDDLLGSGKAMERLRERISLAADAKAPVLIRGERGTGKELVAKAIHEGSKRAKMPYEKLNCAAVPAELIESELFGHEAGAFTGATKQRRGKFERATGGTLFLDEVGDMPPAMQAKLLRVLQEGELERVGGSELIRIDVRVVAATNKNLEEEIEEGRFRADLFDRLNVVPLMAPPLRDRSEDIPMLADHFLAQACANNERRMKRLTEGAQRLLTSYNFPGNVRELRNLIERLVILTADEEIAEREARELLPLDQPTQGTSYYRPGRPLREMVADAERDLILQALDHHQHHMTQTANDLALERSHLYKKMKSLGIRRDD